MTLTSTARLALLGAAAACPEALQELHSVGEGKHQKTAGMFGVLTHPALLDVAAAVCGEELLAHPQFNSRCEPGTRDASARPARPPVKKLHERGACITARPDPLGTQVSNMDHSPWQVQAAESFDVG
jgi:hypothetical protein